MTNFHWKLISAKRSLLTETLQACPISGFFSRMSIFLSASCIPWDCPSTFVWSPDLSSQLKKFSFRWPLLSQNQSLKKISFRWPPLSQNQSCTISAEVTKITLLLGLPTCSCNCLWTCESEILFFINIRVVNCLWPVWWTLYFSIFPLTAPLVVQRDRGRGVLSTAT